jgi:hypothetical protein
VGEEPTTVILPDDQVVTINPMWACVDSAFFGSFRVTLIKDGNPVPSSTPVLIQVQLKIDDESPAQAPNTAPIATLVPNQWTSVGIRVVGKARPRGGTDTDNRLFGMGVHVFSVVVSVDTASLGDLDVDHVDLDFKGALTVGTTV